MTSGKPIYWHKPDFLCTFVLVKKIILIALIISYGFTSFGVSLNYFYCCGKLKSVTLKAQTNPNCSPKKKKGCCQNKKLSLKLTIDQKASEQTKSIVADIPVKTIPSAGYSAIQPEVIVGRNTGNCSFSNGPPPLQKRNILFCVFRI